VDAVKLHCSEKLDGLDYCLGDFWSWAYSDLLSNTVRPLFAEFIVGIALNAIGVPRIEWNSYDLKYKNKKIDVKSSGYLQSWKQKSISKINFDIAKKLVWNSQTNKYSDIPIRSSDIYVFCVYQEKETKEIRKFLGIENWEFYILPTDVLDNKFTNQKTLTLNKLKKTSKSIGFDYIKRQIDTLLDSGN